MHSNQESRPSLEKSSSELECIKAAYRRSERHALVGRLASSVMHEINNPAEAIGNLNYLISGNAHNPELVVSLSRQIEEQLQRIRYVSRQTLSYFRENPQRQETDLVRLIDSVLRYHQPALARKNIGLLKQLPETLVVAVFPGDYLQLLSNLVSNAVDAMADGGLLYVRLRRAGERVRLTVADNGSGIPKHLLTHLFDAFETSKRDAGNGLGLWICKTIAERHGGHLACKTNTEPKTHGTTFSFSIAS